jgi:hypothetical protein
MLIPAEIRSFCNFPSFSSNVSDTENLTLAHVLGEHIETEMLGQPHNVEVSRNLINVRRKHVFTDGIKKIGRPGFQASLPLSVKFADELGSSEGAVDLVDQPASFKAGSARYVSVKCFCWTSK